MRGKKSFTLLGLMAILPIGALCHSPATSVAATEVESIIDELDDASKRKDLYSLGVQSSDVGFGVDNRLYSTYSGDVVPSGSNVWENAFGYIEYDVSGHNALSVFADQPSDVGAPVVYCSPSGFVTSKGSSSQASDNWIRTEYKYDIPADTAWVRIYPIGCNANGIENWMQQMTRIELTYQEAAPAIPTIEDDLNDLSKTNDAYHVTAQTGNVGFGDDNRYLSTYNGEVRPDGANVWENDFGYIQYNVAGQNALSIFADQPSEVGAPVVFCSPSGFVTCKGSSNQASDNWIRTEYKYDIPADTAWVRIFPLNYNSGAVEYWMQQITKVVLSYVEAEPEPEPGPEPVVNKIEDDLNDLSKTLDAYGIAAQSSDVGFGSDGRYTSTKSPAGAPSAANWWDGEYAYLAYALSGQNLATVTVDCGQTNLSVFPHIAFVANYGGLDSRFLEVNNYSVESSSNWSRITYKFVIPEGALWGRAIFSAYDSYDGTLHVWEQQITKIVIEHVDTLPEKDASIPEITPIVRPDTPLEKIEDNLDALEGNGNLGDFYGVQDIAYEEDHVVGLTKSPEEEPTALTWWEGVYGYVQFRVDGRHNFMSVQAYASDNVFAYCPDLMVYAGQGNSLSLVPVHSIVLGEKNAAGLNLVTYNYVLSGQTAARIVFTAYNAPDKSFSTSDQLLTKVTVDCLETIPEADPVSTAHDAYVAELRQYYASIDLKAYDEAERALIKFYINAGIQYLLHGKAKDDVAWVNSVKEKIAALATSEEKFASAKEAYVKELKDAYDSYSSEDYTEENYARITKIYNDALTEIEASNDLDQIALIVSDAKEDMALIEKYVPVTLESIAVSGAKNRFVVGEEFSAEGLKVIATYSDGSTLDVTEEAIVDSSKVKMDTAGSYVVTVSYLSKSTTYTIAVEAEEVPAPTSKGCGGSILAASSLFGCIAVAGIALLIHKKKED